MTIQGNPTASSTRAAAGVATAARPDAPDGYFWLAANMGALADAHGLRLLALLVAGEVDCVVSGLDTGQAAASAVA